MKNIQLEINIQHLALDEMEASDQELVQSAIKATDNAYAKYSHFQVGAALRLDNGDIINLADSVNKDLYIKAIL